MSKPAIVSKIESLSSKLQGLVRGKLWLQVTIAMIAGCGFGFLLGPSTGWVAPSQATLISNWLALPGQVFLSLVKMIVVPLVFASIVRGLASSGDLEEVKQIGSRVIAYFVATTALAIVIGIGITSLIKPGNYVDRAGLKDSLNLEESGAVTAKSLPSIAEVPQRLVELLPVNPLGAMVDSQMLQIVILAVIMGIALLMLKRDVAKPLLDLLETIQEVCMTVVRWAMVLAPVAVFGLLTQLTAKIGLNALLGMGIYVLTVLLGLFVLLALNWMIVFFVSKKSPLGFMSSIKEVFLLAFSTSSSAAVMPLSMKTAIDKLGVGPKVAQFVVPLGATINMNGTALYQGAATIFLAQVFDVQIGLTGILLIVITAVGASIGSPATPGVGIAILSMVLSTVGIPPAGVFLIMGVDRILDMARTAVNVTGDLVACVVTARWIKTE